jgi:hypothetical protein
MKPIGKAIQIVRDEGYLALLRKVGARSLSQILRWFLVMRGYCKFRRLQNTLLRQNYSPLSKRLIVFLTLGYDVVKGGNLSISSIYRETIRMKRIHGAEVVMCTLPGDPRLLRYTKFDNQDYMYPLSSVLSYFQDLESLMIHVPEYSIDQFLEKSSEEDHCKMEAIPDVHVNIMIQNIRLLPGPEPIRKIAHVGKVTCTTAHERYSTPEISTRLGIPLYKLSTYVSPQWYDRTQYSEKEDLVVVSHDPHPAKEAILRTIARTLPNTRIWVVKEITYEEYKKIVRRAKWAVTFGEGLDGYFLETVFSGGIAFATYNDDFFTEDFRSLRTVYPSYEVMLRSICPDIKNLDSERSYVDYQRKQYALCRKYYNYDDYVANLVSFYDREYKPQGLRDTRSDEGRGPHRAP